MSTWSEPFCLMLGNPISTSNYLPDCIHSRHSLLTWNKNSLFILTLSDAGISKILKTITKTKQNPNICGIDTGRESVFPESTWQEFHALKRSPTSTLRAQARLTWAETMTLKGQVVKQLLIFIFWFQDSNEL